MRGIKGAEQRDRDYKTLRSDPVQKIRLWVLSAKRAGGRNAIDEMHAHVGVEEAFQIQGMDREYVEELDGRTTWVPGTYVCRPPNECLHGDALKLTDEHYLLVRTYWTDDPALQQAWAEQRARTMRQVPTAVTFTE